MIENDNIEAAPVQDIMHYESRIWAVADYLISAGIKQSDFPVYMMPFFALMMVEGRMINTVRMIENKYDFTPETHPVEFKQLYGTYKCGYNEEIVMRGKNLRMLCKNDTTFEQDFDVYLKSFDETLKQLLGIDRSKNQQKFLNMDGIVAELRSKRILLHVASLWAEIDLAPYDNSAITTLEEHIKRRWADISASTAGEQYTPDDIIELIARIVALKVSKPQSQVLHGYDPTCGGANLLFGVADRLAHQGYKHISTYGNELNDALYALAAIESRFRKGASIKCGNTLTNVPFSEMQGQFDFIVANPPYGTKWKGFEQEVKNDQLGQFPAGYPQISDGQMLFMQHILWQLADDGVAVEVHNGSTLFSGSAGSGESNIRKYIFDHDWVEAIIQMPQQEFFNTGIYTYLWVMNKNKPAERKNKVALIDGSNGWGPETPSKGDKRRRLMSEHMELIVEALRTFEPSPICKVYDSEHFYYNKQTLVLTELSDTGRSLAQSLCVDGKPHALRGATTVTVADAPSATLSEVTTERAKELAALIDERDLDRAITVATEKNGVYRYDPARRTVVHTLDGTETDLGMGFFKWKTSETKKGTTHKVTLEPYYRTDYEIIPYRRDAAANAAGIEAFMQQYVFKPYTLKDNTVGVELNFNKEFYVPEQLESVEDILKEIEELNRGLKAVEL